MPTYDYACPTCNDVVEVVRAIDASGDVICDTCGTARRKKFGSPPVMFVEKNGSGKFIK